MPLKRIDFATAAPSLDKLPAVGESSYEDGDDEAGDDSSSSGSSNDLGSPARHGHGHHGHGHASASGGSSGGVGGGSTEDAKTKSGLGSLVAHATSGGASRPSPHSVSTSTGAANGGAFGRWLSRRNNQGANAAGAYGGDEESDPDKHYFARGLGRLDDDADSAGASDEEEDQYQVARSHNTSSKLLKSSHIENTANAVASVDGAFKDLRLAGPNGQQHQPDSVPFPPQRPAQPSYDIRSYRNGNAYRESGEAAGGFSSEGGEETESEEEDHPEADARYEWQHMLSNVLQGEVLQKEKIRIAGTLTNDLDTSGNTRKWRAYQIWVRVRAYVRGRTLQQELDYLEEARGQIEGLWEEVSKFRADDAAQLPDKILEIEKPDAIEQIELIIRKIEWCDCLYPSLTSLKTEKAHAASEELLDRIDALLSWQSITKRLRTQIGILQKWTGSDELEVNQPGMEAIDEVSTPLPNQPAQKPVHRLLDTSPFIERIFKEDTLQKTFEKSTINDLYRLVHDAKSVMINCRNQFADMNLPSFYDDVLHLVNFPTKLIQEALKMRLNYVQHISSEQQPSVVLVDQLTTDFRSGLQLAARMKENFLEIMTPNLDEGWPGAQLDQEYDQTLIDSLRFFFKLLNWKLKSGSKAIYLKETEIVENEWKFLSEAVEQIDGGDILVGEHFCMLTHRLLMRVTSYFDEQLQVLEDRDMSAHEMSRWFNQTLDNVRQRHRKLLRFGRAMQQRFENSAEYLLEDLSLSTFVHALAETGHFLVYTHALEAQAMYIIATRSLFERQDLLRQMLSKCFVNNTQADYLDGEFAGDEPHYILILAPHEPFIWTGGILEMDDPLFNFDFDMREGRVRLISDGPQGRLQVSKQIFYEVFPAFKDQVIVEQKAHLGRINRELKKIKRSEYKLAESILMSVERVHAVLRTKAGSEPSLAGYFSFTADLGQRSMKHMEPAMRVRFSMSLMRFAILWVAFICDDCVPSDSRTFKWAVGALEFAMLMTRNEGILRLSSDEFAELRAKVASCMTLLISHFDILGARSSFEAKKEKERLDVAKEEIRQQLKQTLAYLNSVDHIRQNGKHQVSADATDSALYFDDQALSESLNKVRTRWITQTQEIEQRRLELEGSMRVVGRVLDSERPEDKSLLFLATSNSNISVRWQQGKFIGGGTFGSVYLAVNLDSGGLMAVKEIKFQDLTSAPHLIKQIRDEMQVMEMLSHPNIVEYYGIEVHRDKVYIFEEYCQGGSLANLLEHGRIEDESVIQIYTVQLLDGLIYLHSMGVVHRDIKPDNILLDHMGVIKYVDFGAAKVLAKNQKTMAAKTRAPGPGGDVNSLTGTPMYMSPEVIKGDHRGRRGAMDIWSLGCVVLECATGRRPWSNLDNEWAIMFHIGIATKHPPLPEKGELSDLGIDFVRACLNIDPGKRPSATELMEHPWIQAFSEEIAQEMQMNESGGGQMQAVPEEDEDGQYDEYAEAQTPGGDDQYEEGAFLNEPGELPDAAQSNQDHTVQEQ